jgi:anti-sigma regulatory factor (Ser/Thr protein kinase)
MIGSIGAARKHRQDSGRAGRSPMPGPDAGFGHWRLASTLEFGPLPTAVPCARLHAKHIVREWNLAHITDDAELIVSELMTNALKAARSQRDIQPITLRLLAGRDYLLIQVWDAVTAAPAPAPHAIDAETGRGLEIVTLLSDRWGFYHPAGGGKVVWAALMTGTAPSTPQGDRHMNNRAAACKRSCACTGLARVCTHWALARAPCTTTCAPARRRNHLPHDVLTHSKSRHLP